MGRRLLLRLAAICFAGLPADAFLFAPRLGASSLHLRVTERTTSPSCLFSFLERPPAPPPRPKGRRGTPAPSTSNAIKLPTPIALAIAAAPFGTVLLVIVFLQVAEPGVRTPFAFLDPFYPPAVAEKARLKKIVDDTAAAEKKAAAAAKEAAAKAAAEKEAKETDKKAAEPKAAEPKA